MRSGLTTAAEVLGVALVAAGAFVLAPWLGLVVAGTLLVALGFLLGDPRLARHAQRVTPNAQRGDDSPNP